MLNLTKRDEKLILKNIPDAGLKNSNEKYKTQKYN